eukprot:5386908-Pyramimonas_sp.AAC.1
MGTCVQWGEDKNPENTDGEIWGALGFVSTYLCVPGPLSSSPCALLLAQSTARWSAVTRRRV